MERETLKLSPIWAYFTKKDRGVATCNTCHKDYSYRTSVTNLKKHWLHKHGKLSDLTDQSNSSDSSDGEEDFSTAKRKSLSTWQNFEVLDSDKYEACCKLCEKVVKYETVSDLRKHVQEHNEKPKDDDDETFEVQEKKSYRSVSKLWQHFKVVDSENNTAVCRLCKGIFSFATTVSSLRKHLERKHPEVDIGLDNKRDHKRVIISTNGQLYEIETGSHKVDVGNHEKDPIQTDTVYLDEMEDSMERVPTPLPTPKKKAKISFKRDYSRIASEPVKSSINTCSEEPLQKRNVHSTIDIFGQYVVSLLKELPNSVSNHLQSDFIKQIFASKTALEPQAPQIKYTIINQSDTNQSHQVLTEPMTYSIGETNVVSVNNNDAMVVGSTENHENH